MILIDSNVPMYLIGAPHPHKIDAMPFNRRSTCCSASPMKALPIDQRAAERAEDIVMGHRRLSVRDALHIAVMEQQGIERILSFDSGFDGFRGISRLR